MLLRKIALLTLVSLPLAGVAQPPGPQPLDIENLAILLDLDSYLQTEVERIFAARREAMRALRDSTDERPSREEMRATRQAARTEMLTELRSVLSAGQIEKFEALTELLGRGRGRGRFAR